MKADKQSILKKLISITLLFSMVSSIVPVTAAGTAEPVDGGTIDLTSFATGDTSSHNHIWEQKFDENNHWQECRLCHKQQQVAPHHISYSYTGNPDNPQIGCTSKRVSSCDCGYDKTESDWEGKKYHCTPGDTDIYYGSAEGFCIYREWCGNGNQHGLGEVPAYDANGNLFDYSIAEKGPFDVYTKENGELVFKGKYNKVASCYPGGELDTSKWSFTWNGTEMIWHVDDTITTSYDYPDLNNCREWHCYTNSLHNTEVKRYDNFSYTNVTKNSVHCVVDIVLDCTPFTDFTKGLTPPFVVACRNAYDMDYRMYSPRGRLRLAEWQPTISSVAPTYGQNQGGYAMNTSLRIQGHAQGTAFIYVTVKDKNNISIIENRLFNVPSNDSFDIIVPLQGASFSAGDLTVEVKNVHEQVATSTCHVDATDMLGPTLDNKDAIDLNSSWSGSKDLVMNISDAGIGGIQVSLNTEDNYTALQPGQSGSIVYHLTGDVPSEKNIIVFAKDALGNVSTFELPIDKFDMTPPATQSLEYTEDENTQPILTATTTDNSGAGLLYQFNDGPWQSSNVLNVTADGHYTVRVKDAAGNVSPEVSTDVTMRRYNVTFYDEDRSTVLSSEQYVYGQEVIEPQTPTKPADEYNTYQFGDWSTPVVNCVGSAQYYAQYEPTPVEYTVTFQNWDGTTIKQDKLHYGDAVEAPTEEPTKEADMENTYTFAGWGEEVATTCTGDKTYTAQYTAVPIVYHVRFLNWDGTVLSEADYNYGDVMDVPTPTRDADDEFTYVFAGWSPEPPTTCTGTKDYTAQFDVQQNEYTVTFQDWDGHTISSDTYTWNAPVTCPDAPVRDADDTYTYTFSGWSPEVSDVCKGSAIYTAQYDKEYIDYTITFNDSDNTEYYKYTSHWGEPIIIPPNPTKQSDGVHYYTFSKWTPDITLYCDGDKVYTAEYVTGMVDYTVEFKNWDGSVVSSVVCNYGDAIAAPEPPTRDSDAQYDYVFDKWSPDVDATVTGNHTYYALFKAVPREYSVVFKDWDGSVISSDTYHWGDTVKVPDASRPSDSEYTYTFAHWSPEFSDVVTGDAIYTAVYDKTAIPSGGSGGGSGGWDDGGSKPAPDKPEPNPDAPKEFDDTDGHWAEEYIDFCTSHGLMSGTSENTFEPNSIVTRASAITVLYNMAKDKTVDIEKSFPDVPTGVWYSTPIAWGLDNGVAVGFPDGSFHPEVNITREQFVVMVWQNAGKEIVGNCISSYHDKDEVSNYAVDAMNWAVHNHIIQGTTATTLAPKDNISRGEIAAILYKLNSNMPSLSEKH